MRQFQFPYENEDKFVNSLRKIHQWCNSSVTSEVSQNVPEGSVGRWGGEEFMVLLPNTDIQRAKSVAELLRVHFSMIEFTTAPSQSISLGVTQLVSGEDADTFCNRVDKALYTGKNNGKNQVVLI